RSLSRARRARGHFSTILFYSRRGRVLPTVLLDVPIRSNSHAAPNSLGGSENPSNSSAHGPPFGGHAANSLEASNAIGTRRELLVEDLHGQLVADPYRWLEDGAASEVRAWAAAQTARTEAILQSRPGYAALLERLAMLLRVGAVEPPVAV